MDNILDIFYEYTINNKVLDRIAISKILDTILKVNNFDKTIKYVISKEDDKMNLSNYGTQGEFDMVKTINIYYFEMLKNIKRKKHLSKYGNRLSLNNIEITGKKNLLILETLIHEVEHVKQVEKVKYDLYNTDIETKLYKYEINYKSPSSDIFDTGIIKYMTEIFKHGITYEMNYDYSFMERMANINTSEQMTYLLNNLGNEFKRLADTQKKITNLYITKYYKEYIYGPTTKFIITLGYNKDFTKEDMIKITDTMSFDKRLRYGFPITLDEYQKIRRLKV